MSLVRLPDGNVIQDCFSGNADTPSASSKTNTLIGRVSTPCPWGALRSNANPQNRVILELYNTAKGPVLWLYKPDHNPALFDELSQQLTSFEDPPRWVLPALGDETTDTFVRFIKPLTDAFFRRTNEHDLADDDPAQLDAAEELARGVLLWRYGMPESATQADTARAKGLWGELTVLNHLEAPIEGGLENASSCWKAFGAKWDIEKTGVTQPLEVKTTQRNTHTHELRHNQLNEGVSCHLRLVSVRCSQTVGSDVPTLKEMLVARRNKAELLGTEGELCVARVNLELERLTAAEKDLRLQQEGTIVTIPVSALPAFPSFPAEYRDLKYTVDLAADGLVSDHLFDMLPPTNAVSRSEPEQPMLGGAPESLLQEAGAENVERHVLTMNWALKHSNQNMAWREIQEAAKLLMGEDGHIVSQAKGIYKAAGTPWVRSVRHTPGSGHHDETLSGGKHWYAFEQPKGKPSHTEKREHKYRVELVWVIEFDVDNRRCLLATDALRSLPLAENALELPETDAHTNRALWLNYIHQIPLVYLRGF
jgi:hypothetical protein